MMMSLVRTLNLKLLEEVRRALGEPGVEVKLQLHLRGLELQPQEEEEERKL